jgi:antitoxin (DNA-binding transcriptional repressor) of toxin-antitoxin stability system
MTRTIPAGEARSQLPGILDDAEKGTTTVIYRHSKPSAFVAPANLLGQFELFQRVMREVGESLEVSRDPEIIAAVRRAQDAINRGHIIWDEGEEAEDLPAPRAKKKTA